MSEDPLERCKQCRALRWQTRQEKEAGWLPACLSLRLLSLFVGHWTIAWLAGWQCHLGPWWCWYWNCCRCPRQRQRYCCCNGCCKLIDCVSSSGLNDCLTDGLAVWLADSARTPSYLRGKMRGMGQRKAMKKMLHFIVELSSYADVNVETVGWWWSLLSGFVCFLRGNVYCFNFVISTKQTQSVDPNNYDIGNNKYTLYAQLIRLRCTTHQATIFNMWMHEWMNIP